MDGEAVKVALEAPDGEVETLWANAVGPGQYALDNLPWFAYGVSLGDVVEASPDAALGGPDGVLAFRRVVRKSGNRTLRVILATQEPGTAWTYESERLLARLSELGCSYEGYNRRLLAVNVPPESDLAAVVAALTESGLDWEHADPTYEELYPDEGDDAGAGDA